MMIQTIESTINTRQHFRIPVQWHARAELGSSVIAGKVRDWSEGGLCFQPEFGYLDGCSVIGHDALAHLGPTDEIKIFLLDDENRARAINGEIRWTGWSQAHSCPAIGIEKRPLH